MDILTFPTRMSLVRIEAPAEHEMLSALVRFLDRTHRLLDQSRQSAISLVSTLVGGVRMLGVRFHAWKRRSTLAFRCFAGAASQLCSSNLRVDFGHRGLRSGDEKKFGIWITV